MIHPSGIHRAVSKSSHKNEDCANLLKEVSTKHAWGSTKHVWGSTKHAQRGETAAVVGSRGVGRHTALAPRLVLIVKWRGGVWDVS